MNTTATLHDAQLFADMLGAPEDIIEVRLIHTSGVVKSLWFERQNLADHLDELSTENAKGFNVYIGVNPRPRVNARGDDCIVMAHVNFADFDGSSEYDVLAAISRAGLPEPHLLINSGHGIHCYWLLSAPCIDLAAWRELQCDIAKLLNSDPKVQNPERVMRAPVFLNLKREPVLASILHATQGESVEFETLRSIIPRERARQLENPVPDSGNHRGNGHVSIVDRCMKYLAKTPNAVDGQGGHDATLRAAAECFRFGLSDSDAAQVMAWFNQSKCIPPWTDREIEHKLADAHRIVSEAGEIGMRLRSKANGKSAPKPPTPVDDEGEFEQEQREPLPELIPLSDPDPPEFPDGIFGGWLGDTVEAVSANTETPKELAASMALGTVAIAVQGKLSLLVEPNYFEQLSLYLASFLTSGNRKTAVVGYFVAPLIQYERNRRAEIEPQIKRIQTERKAIQSELKGLHEQVVKKAGGDCATLIEKINELEASMPDEPVSPRVFCQDVTMEHLGTMLSRHGERMGIVSDEGGIFDLISGRYNSSIPNLDLVLQSYTGGAVRQDRGCREPVMLNHPALSMAISPQPEVAEGLAARPGFRGRGLLSRFAFSMPRSMLGLRTLTAHPIPEETTKIFTEYVIQLLAIKTPAEDSRNGPHVLKLDNEAYQIWKEYQRTIEDQMKPGGRLEHLTDVGGKWPGMAARFAGILHIADYGAESLNYRTINRDVTSRATKLADFFLEHGLAVFGHFGANKPLQIARRLWAEILKLGQMSFRARDAWQPMKGTYRTMDEVQPGFAVLIERGWLLEPEQDERRGPGRPSRRFTVNPKASVFFASPTPYLPRG